MQQSLLRSRLTKIWQLIHQLVCGSTSSSETRCRNQIEQHRSEVPKHQVVFWVKSGERDWPHSVTTERAPESWKTKRCACSTGRDKVKVTTEQGCVLSVIHPDGAKSDWASSWVISTLAAREQRTEMSVQWNLDAKCRATAAHPARQISRCARRCSSDAQSLTKGSAESTIASNLAKSVIVMSWHLEAKMANGINGTASEPGTVEQKSVLKIEMGNATDKC